ncbi:MAG: hypothetical protein AAB817_00515 [Patescibacteria group bacterium]
MVVYLDGSQQNRVTMVMVDANGTVRGQIKRRGQWHQSDKIIGLIDQLLAQTRPRRSAITGMIIVRGPGSFTGTRLSVTIANALGYAGQWPLVGLIRRDQETATKLINRGCRALSQSPRRRVIQPLYDSQPHITVTRR